MLACKFSYASKPPDGEATIILAIIRSAFNFIRIDIINSLQSCQYWIFFKIVILVSKAHPESVYNWADPGQARMTDSRG